MCGPSELGILSTTIKSSEVIIFYSECSSHTNYLNLIILPNGSLFISERFLEEVLEIGGIEGLTFVILHELSHIIRRDIIRNLVKS